MLINTCLAGCFGILLALRMLTYFMYAPLLNTSTIFKTPLQIGDLAEEVKSN